MIHDVPTLKEELERKTVEVLSELDRRIRSGSIDPRGAWVTAQTVWTLTAGLVSNEASQAAAELANQNPCQAWRRVFIHTSKPTLLLKVVPGRAFVLSVVNAATGSTTALKSGRSEPGELEELVDRIATRLKGDGYIEI